jgi:beta-phosphoglucomutase-like phosphatase (HAD superfamily)
MDGILIDSEALHAYAKRSAFRLVGIDRVRQNLAQALFQAELEIDDSTFAGKTAKQPMSLRDVQGHLRPEELILEYVVAEPNSFVLAITDHTLHKYDLPSSKVIESLASQYRKISRARR